MHFIRSWQIILFLNFTNGHRKHSQSLAGPVYDLYTVSFLIILVHEQITWWWVDRGRKCWHNILEPFQDNITCRVLWFVVIITAGYQFSSLTDHKRKVVRQISQRGYMPEECAKSYDD